MSGWGAAAVAGAAIIGSLSGSAAQKSATKKAIKEQQRQFDLTRADNLPWIQAGTTSLGQLTEGTKDGGEFNRNFTAEDFNADPGYAFRFNEGQRALDAGASARGGILSGRALRETARYGQDYASNEFSNAYNRFNNDRSVRFDRLSSIAGLGQTAQRGVDAARGNMANNVSEYRTQGGNATAAGYAGASQAVQNFGNTLGNFYQQRQLQKQYQDSLIKSSSSTDTGVSKAPLG